jgi:hypothetical protein
VLALRAALTGAPWFIVSAWLLAAGAAHAWDVALRWRANASSAHGREQKLVGRVGIEPTTKGL